MHALKSPATSLLARLLACSIVAVAVRPLPQCLAQNRAAPPPPMIQYLESRTQADPSDASNWRLLGRFHLKHGNLDKAELALRRAIELEPLSAAAHCDYAETSLARGLLQQAANHFDRAASLAPESDYASTARKRLAELPPPQSPDTVQMAGFEVKRFDGSQRLRNVPLSEDPVVTPYRPWSVRIETGAQYNTNVTLTPTSRDLSAASADSFQGFFSPELEYRWLDGPLWRLGPTFTGYFSLNENEFQQLNLQSYQPGAFVERSVPLSNTVLVPRVQYQFTLDEFDGQQFANRHALQTSVVSFWDRGDTTVAYWSLDHTDFTDDGTTPEFSSRDGWTNTLGLSHTLPIERRFLESLTSGVEVQLADTFGSDFAYQGVSLFGEAVVPLTDSLVWILEGGWGYRDYHRFPLTPSRNEHIWRAGTRLRQQIINHVALEGTFSYDLFDSENANFDAQRYIAGVMSVVEF